MPKDLINWKQIKNKEIMTTFRKTIEAYKKGQKAMAYLAFKNDPTANKDVTFEKFCDFMEKTIGSIQSVCPVTGKVERA